MHLTKQVKTSCQTVQICDCSNQMLIPVCRSSRGRVLLQSSSSQENKVREGANVLLLHYDHCGCGNCLPKTTYLPIITVIIGLERGMILSICLVIKQYLSRTIRQQSDRGLNDSLSYSRKKYQITKNNLSKNYFLGCNVVTIISEIKVLHQNLVESIQFDKMVTSSHQSIRILPWVVGVIK